mmetsp:Transcript_42484/g.71758  ORF Transcript_42484/g.71758 Transcript_42484/m.71758 type:complete len:279 (-) Transcript_42484:3277-4113(-)
MGGARALGEVPAPTLLREGVAAAGLGVADLPLLLRAEPRGRPHGLPRALSPVARDGAGRPRAPLPAEVGRRGLAVCLLPPGLRGGGGRPPFCRGGLKDVGKALAGAVPSLAASSVALRGQEMHGPPLEWRLRALGAEDACVRVLLRTADGDAVLGPQRRAHGLGILQVVEHDARWAHVGRGGGVVLGRRAPLTHFGWNGLQRELLDVVPRSAGPRRDGHSFRGAMPGSVHPHLREGVLGAGHARRLHRLEMRHPVDDGALHFDHLHVCPIHRRHDPGR